MVFLAMLKRKPFILVIRLCCLILIIFTETVTAQLNSNPDKYLDNLILPENISSEVLSSRQPTREINGIVKDDKGQPLIGATVMVKGTTTGVITNTEGRFTLFIPADAEILVVSFVGMVTQEITVEGKTSFEIILTEDLVGLEEVVIIGYGSQKRESIVGAITNTTSETLERRSGVVNLGSVLSGQIPGVMVMERTGEPGREDPYILIRGQSTWNEATPLILVDGIERRMNDINVYEVASISVLKDASATAVFGVKGANGVILITTRRGQLGKAKLSMSANVGIKNISKIFTLTEATTSQLWKNAGIEHEVSAYDASWSHYRPYEEVMKYKRPQQYPDLYPNVDWPKEMLKPFATNKQFNMNVSGGTKLAKYFASIAYTNEGDILQSTPNDKGYDPGFKYDRMNFRGNLDFELTKTTTLSTNISGYYGKKQHTMAFTNDWIFQSLYTMPPDVFPARYSDDGVYGKDLDKSYQNPLAILNEAGVVTDNRLFIGSDFKLEQKLDFITPGLSVNGRLSFDNYFGYSGPNILDASNQGQTLYKYVYPEILNATSRQDTLNATVWIPTDVVPAVYEYDWVLKPWTVQTGSLSNSALQRTLFYQLSLQYNRSFNKHDVSTLLLFNRRQTATGSNFPSYREDWVGRTTYSFRNTYFTEINAAYNGSEKFGPDYRFGFFPSFAAGWMISNESFLQQYDWLYKLKIRGSVGKVGSDAGIPRWAYISSWTTGGQALFGNNSGSILPQWFHTSMFSPYTFNWEGTIANSNLHWETAIKKNIGIELSLLENMISFEADIFKDDRKDILLSSSQRNIPVFFGANPVPINYGITQVKGFELDFMFRKRTETGISYWFRQSMTRAKDVIIRAEDPELQLAYLKREGFQIGQTKTQVRDGSVANSWDDVYAQTPQDVNIYNLPGDWGIIDYNGDGVINSFDQIPYGYPNSRPGNTYSTYLGFGYKGFSSMIQFYGVTNITQNVTFFSPGLSRSTRLHEYLADYWTKYNPNSEYKAPRVGTSSLSGDFTQFDGSFLRLKTAEIAYTLSSELTKQLGLSNVRFFLNGNNLFFWSDLPLDIERGGFSLNNSYPTYRVFNLGVNVDF